MFLIIKWSERISTLWGLDQPTKNLNLTMEYSEFAKQSGVTRKDLLLGLVRETVELLKTVPVTREDVQPLIDVIGEINFATDVTPDNQNAES